MNKFATCLWFNGKIDEAAKYYQSIFKNTKIGKTSFYGSYASQIGMKEGDPLVIEMSIENIDIQLLNGGPQFKMTPAISFFISAATVAEAEELWKKLSAGGNVRMGLDKYPWSEKYGWTADKFGVEWQIMVDKNPNKIRTALLFVDALVGKGEEALNLYTSIFPNSKIDMLHKDPNSGLVMHSAFNLCGENFVLMEGPGKHGYTFNEGTSITVYCDDQKEVDAYWDKLIAGGGSPSQCGWLKDKFGVSWQVVPREFVRLVSDPKTSQKVMNVMFTMQKFDIAKLQQAAKS